MDYVKEVVSVLFKNKALSVIASIKYVSVPTHRLLFYKDLKNVKPAN